MDIYFVRISHEEVYTMTHITKHKIDEWYEKYINQDICFYLDDPWDNAEFYLIATDVTEFQCRKYINSSVDFIADYKQYTRDICEDYRVKSNMVFNNEDIYEEEVLPELEQLKYRADNPVGRFVLAESLKEDGIDDIFDEEDNCPHCGTDRGDHEISDRNRLIPCESDGEGDEDEKDCNGAQLISGPACIKCCKCGIVPKILCPTGVPNEDGTEKFFCEACNKN